MLKPLLAILALVILFIGIRNYVDHKIGKLEEQYLADITDLYERMSAQNDLIIKAIKK